MPRVVCVKRGWKDDTVRHRVGENLTRQRVALDAAGGGKGRRNEAKEKKEAKGRSLAQYLTNQAAIHSEAHQRD